MGHNALGLASVVAQYNQLRDISTSTYRDNQNSTEEDEG